MDTINEGSTATYTATLTGPDGVQIEKAILTEITLTLYDRITGNVINGRDAQDILDANDVSIATDGTLTWELQPEDTVIVNIAKRGEWHVGLFRYTWTNGKHTHEVRMRIVNLFKNPPEQKVPNG